MYLSKIKSLVWSQATRHDGVPPKGSNITTGKEWKQQEFILAISRAYFFRLSLQTFTLVMPLIYWNKARKINRRGPFAITLFKEQYSCRTHVFPMRSNARTERTSRARGSTVTNPSVKFKKTPLITSVYSYSITRMHYTRDNRTDMLSQQFFENMDLSRVPKEFIFEIW